MLRWALRWVDVLRHHPCGVLFLVQLLGILVYPFLGGSPVGRAVFGIFAVWVLAIAVYAVRLTPALTWVSTLIGVPVVLLTVVEAIQPDHGGIALASALCHAAFYFYTGYALIRYMFDDDIVTTDEVLATGATFTVVAWAFAYLYVATQIVWPGSFGPDPDVAASWMDLLFLSVTTLTSTGLSDIVPIRPHARSFVMIEQIAGMLYLALVVARIMALLTARAAARANRS